LDQFEDRIVAFCNSNLVQEIFVDGTGLGGGLVDHLRRRGYLVHDVQFGGKAQQQIDGVKYGNKRAEIWGLMRNALRYMCLPQNNAALREQLCGPEYDFSRTGDAIMLEPKAAMKLRGVPSPDLADALACTFGAEIATLPMLADWVPGQGVVSEYNPFDDQYMRPDEGKAPHYKPRFTPAPGYAGLKSDDWSNDDLGDAMMSDRLRWEKDDADSSY
jgi:hypothetical protein